MEDYIKYREEAKIYYESALKAGKKYFSDNDSNHQYLPTFDEVKKETRIAGELQIGVHEIVLKKIIGTYASGRSASFAGNFMPLLEASTEFGEKWISLCASHLKEGIHDPIKVYEYLGYYYVVEGNKRVSVLKTVGAYSIHAEVIRAIPERSEEKDIQLFYEFLDFNKKRLFDEMWFSEVGRFTKLVQTAREFANNHSELEKDTDLEWMFQSFRDFSRRYREFESPLAGSVTTGDAYLRFVEIYGFPLNWEYGELEKKVKTFIPETLMMNESREDQLDRVEVSLKVQEEKSWAALLRFVRKKTPVIGFVFNNSSFHAGISKAHQASISVLKDRLSPNVNFEVEVATEDRLEAAFQSLVSKNPGVIFSTGMNQRFEALKSCLEQPDIRFLCCSPLIENNSMSTYNARLYEGMFLFGIVAGMKTKTNHVGIIGKNVNSYLLVCDINAFCEGVHFVNPDAQVHLIYLNNDNYQRNTEEARWRLYEQNVDVFVTGDLHDGPAIDRLTSDTVFILNSLGNNAIVDEYYSVLTINWTRFYRKIAQQLLEGTADEYRPGNPVHYRWGIAENLINVLLVEPVLNEPIIRNIHFMKQMIVERRVPIYHGLPATFSYKDVIDQKELNPLISITANDFPERKWD